MAASQVNYPIEKYIEEEHDIKLTCYAVTRYVTTWTRSWIIEYDVSMGHDVFYNEGGRRQATHTGISLDKNQLQTIYSAIFSEKFNQCALSSIYGKKYSKDLDYGIVMTHVL